MCMDEFVNKFYDFMGIYRIFWSQNSHYRYFTNIYRYFFRNSSTCTCEIKVSRFFFFRKNAKKSPKNQRFFHFIADFFGQNVPVRHVLHSRDFSVEKLVFSDFLTKNR